MLATAKSITIPVPVPINSLNCNVWIGKCEIIENPKSTKIQYPPINMYISLKNRGKVSQSIADEERRKMVFTVSEYNLSDVQEVFREAYDWLFGQSRKLVYALSEKNNVVFNEHCQNVFSTFIDNDSATRCAIRLAPTLVEVANGQNAPGVILSINSRENYVTLTEREFRRLAYMIFNFSFITYIQFAYQVISVSKLAGRDLTEEELKHRLAVQRQYNTNIRY